MSRVRRDTSIKELAAIVSEALEAEGVVAVLSGGAAVAIYTDNRYQSYDLDFVTSESLSRITNALAPLGFTKRQDRYFGHPDTDLYLEFHPGPPAVGDRVIREWTSLKTPYGNIQILSPTQMVMDRLAAFIHWNDPQSLEQAVMVARDQTLDWADLDAWALEEDAADHYETFKRALRRD